MKKFCALILAIVMVATLFVGCGSNTNETKAPENTNSANSTTPNENGGTNVSTGAIKIGMTGPLTGGAAVYGTAVKAAMEIAVEEINAMGGLQLELNCQDDEHDAEKAVNAYNNLKDWGMQIMAGSVTSAPCLALAPECNADDIFMLTPSATADKVLDCGDNVFQICFKDTNQGFASADYLAAHFPDASIGVIYDSSDAYSTGIYNNFAAQAEANGLKVVCAEAFTSDNKSDLSTQVTKCQSAGADLVFLPFYATEAAQVLTYTNKIGYEARFFGCDGMDGILTTEGFDASLAEGLMMLTPFSADSEDEATKAFVAKYMEKTGITPNQFAADAYDVIYALYAALNDTGCTADMSSAEISEKMVGWFTTNSFDGLTGSNMTWDATGAVSKTPMAVVIENGVYVGMD